MIDRDTLRTARRTVERNGYTVLLQSFHLEIEMKEI